MAMVTVIAKICMYNMTAALLTLNVWKNKNKKISVKTSEL
jgi:hypothetical protein